ncbi:MAG: tetratricopeptide repeat-containing sensor histidine kinase [Cyclobacteriaceae bacterium]|nr:MAG: tetratricopeptide repeat-containing sensor histidine kinase [Cyclobacteriaceae bacterium]
MKANWLILFGIISISVQAQQFDAAGSEAQMQGLTDQQKVQFINQNFYALYSADFNNAKSLAEWAATIAAENGWKKDEGYAQMNWGVVTYLSGDYEHVPEKYFKSISLFEELNDKTGLAAVNNEMAVFYHKQNEVDRAMACLDVAEKYARETNDLTRLGTTLAHRGAFLSRKGKIEEARPYYMEVYQIRKQTADSVGLGYVLLDLSEIALHQGNLSQALTYIDESTRIRQKIGDKQGQAVNAVTKGEVLLQAKRIKEAIASLQDGLKQGETIGYTDLVKFTLGALANAHLQLDDYKSAYQYQEQHHALNDSLFNLDKAKVIQEMQAKYETVKKENEILLLKQENQLKDTKLAQSMQAIVILLVVLALILALGYLWKNRLRLKQQAELQATRAALREGQLKAVIASQEEERKRFAADLHDGFGQMISALRLSLSKEKIEKPTVEHALGVLNEMNLEIRNIAFNLMPQVLVKSGLEEALKEFAARINRSGPVSVAVQTFDLDVNMPDELRIALYRICQEWVNNILKYGHANQVTIQMVQHPQELVLTIEDDGDGFELSKLTAGQGNGWKNINSRLHMIKGNIEIDTTPGRKGTTLVATVPLSIAQAA